MLICCIISLVLSVDCDAYLFVPKRTRRLNPSPKAFAAHVNDFLRDIQQQIRFTELLINDLDMDHLFKKNSFLDSKPDLITEHPSTMSIFAYNPTTKRPVTIKPSDGEDILHQKKQTSNHEYFCLGLEKLLECMISKNAEDVAEVIKHSETIFKDIRAHGRLMWLGPLLLSLITETVISFSHNSMFEMNETLNIRYKQIQTRNKSFTKQTNSLLDRANKVIIEEDGEHLLIVIEEFRKFPNVAKTGMRICRDILEAFERPYKRLEGLAVLQELMRDADHALMETSRRDGARLSWKDRWKKTTPPTLEHVARVDRFLNEIHKDIKLSRYIISSIDVENMFNFSTAKPPATMTGSFSILDQFDPEDGDLTRNKKKCRNCLPDILGAKKNKYYYTVGYTKFMKDIATKKSEHVRAVLSHSKDILKEMIETDGGLSFLGHPLQMVVCRVFKSFTDLPIKVLQQKAGIDYRVYKNRYKEYNPLVNIAMDKLNNLIDDQDGEHLNAVLNEFARFPNVNKTGKEMCHDVLHAFRTLLWRHKDTEEVRDMFKLANNVVKFHHPEWRDVPREEC